MRQLAAAVANRRDDRARPLAPVERAGALFAIASKVSPRSGQPQRVAGDEPCPRRAAVDPAGLVAVPDDRVEHRVHVRLRPRELDAVAGQLGGRREQLAPREAPVAPCAPPRGRRRRPGRRRPRGRSGRAGWSCRRFRTRRRSRSSCLRGASSNPSPGAETKKSASRVERSRARWMSMNPPAAGLVRKLSQTARREQPPRRRRRRRCRPPRACVRPPGGQRMTRGDGTPHGAKPTSSGTRASRTGRSSRRPSRAPAAAWRRRAPSRSR